MAHYKTETSSIHDLLPLGICELDSGMIVHSWNETLSRWTGISAQEAIGMDLGTQFPNLKQSRYFRRLTQSFEQKIPAIFSAALHRHFLPVPLNGQEDKFMIQETQVRPIPECDNRFLVIIQDVTSGFRQMEELRSERKRLKEAQIAAEAANQTKSSFLANMSHEIRTPMTAILGFTDILIEENWGRKASLENLSTIKRNGNLLLTIINDILDLSKIEAGKIDIEKCLFSPLQLVSEIYDLMLAKAQEKEIELLVEFSGPLPASIESDPTRIRQILINLIGNAIKFTPTGSVTLKPKFESIDSFHRLSFQIIDTGIGLSEEQLGKLFQPFIQADVSTTRKFGGTGLGLTICKRLSEIMGSELAVESKCGVGSTFSVSFPIDLQAESEFIEKPILIRNPVVKSIKPLGNNSNSLQNARILLAEDGIDNQRLVSMLVKKTGANIDVVENGQLAVDQALAAYSQGTPYDVILMDMQMPVLDGLQATRALRDKNYSSPIIALTAHAMQGDREKYLTAGCDDYATKPINRTKLVQLLEKYCNQSNSEMVVTS